MDTIVFNVKEKSINHFFEQHAIDYYREDRSNSVMRGSGSISAYHLMRDDLYLKKSSGIQENQQVVFELSDEAAGSGTKLLNTYTYQSEKYDDVGIKLKLIDFRITTQPK